MPDRPHLPVHAPPEGPAPLPSPGAPLLVAAGYLNLDIVARVPHLPRGDERVTALAIRRGLGGMAANVAAAAAALGAPYPVRAELVSAVGADPDGDWLLAGLRKRSIGTEGIARGAEGTTCRCLILVEADGRRAIVSEPLGFPKELLRRRIERGDPAGAPPALYLDGYRIPDSLPAAERARALGWTVALDLDGLAADRLTPAGFDHLFGAVDVLFLNRATARVIWPGVPWHDAGRLSTAAAEFAMILGRHRGRVSDGGGATVLLTLAEDGVLVADAGGGCRHVPATRVTPVDTTGAGDVFAGAFLAAWLHRAPADEAARFAAAAAALAIGREATERTPPTGVAVVSLLPRS